MASQQTSDFNRRVASVLRRVAVAAHRPPAHEDLPEIQAEEEKEGQVAEVIPLGIFDARAEADRWPS